jgi:hypothetical protein
MPNETYALFVGCLSKIPSLMEFFVAFVTRNRRRTRTLGLQTLALSDPSSTVKNTRRSARCG